MLRGASLMTALPFTIEREPRGRIRVDLRGAFDEASEVEFVRAVEGALAREPGHVLIVLSNLGGFDVRLRNVLLAAQRSISARGRRTVYLADRPRLRGMALWVVHIAEDNRAKVVGNAAAAEEWLSGDSERVEHAAQRTETALARIWARRKAVST